MEILDTRAFCPDITSMHDPWVPLLQSEFYRTCPPQEMAGDAETLVSIVTIAIRGTLNVELWVSFGALPFDDPSDKMSYSFGDLDEALWAHVAMARYLTPVVPVVPPPREALIAWGRGLRRVQHG